MNIRLTPHQLSTLKALAGEAGLRPGELVTQWVEERLAGARGGAAAAPAQPSASLAAEIKALAARVAALEAGGMATAAVAPAAAEPAAAEPAAASVPEEVAIPKRRGRPPKSASAAPDGTAAAGAAAAGTATAATAKRAPRARRSTTTSRRAQAGGTGTKRVPLHEEIIAVIGERGPMTAAELATTITERGVFQPPRSGKALDAATVNSRVSNPVYRARFRRDGHRITLAD
jgi:hypothetical protein